MNRNVLVVELQLDVVAVSSTDTQRKHRLVVVGWAQIVLSASDDEALLVVLLHQGHYLMHSPTALRMLVEDIEELCHADPGTIESKELWLDRTSHNAGKCSLQI